MSTINNLLNEYVTIMNGPANPLNFTLFFISVFIVIGFIFWTLYGIYKISNNHYHERYYSTIEDLLWLILQLLNPIIFIYVCLRIILLTIKWIFYISQIKKVLRMQNPIADILKKIGF